LFNIQCIKGTSDDSGRLVFFACFTGNAVRLHDLVPNTSYVFNVRARNDVGYGNFISIPVTTSPPRKFTFDKSSVNNIFCTNVSDVIL